MQKLVITGGIPLEGTVTLQGAKNSVLPILAASLLCRGETVLENCPRLTDVFSACRILTALGCRCSMKGHVARIQADGVDCVEISESLMQEMRSSIIFLGALLGRYGSCTLSYPGGCELGPRPIDMHLQALRSMGAEIVQNGGRLLCRAAKGLRGKKISFKYPSVGATENIMLAAVLAKGTTIIYNAAREPEICDLASFLRQCGAKIYGDGGDTITIEGVSALHGTVYRIMPDRIVGMTYLTAAAMTGGTLQMKQTEPSQMENLLPVLEQAGCRLDVAQKTIYLHAPARLRALPPIRTMPHPGFPTDAQAIVMAMLTGADGVSVFEETVFENRYRHVDALLKMGAEIYVSGQTAVVKGVRQLSGAPVRATDLRGGAAMVDYVEYVDDLTVLGEPWEAENEYDLYQDFLLDVISWGLQKYRAKKRFLWQICYYVNAWATFYYIFGREITQENVEQWKKTLFEEAKERYPDSMLFEFIPHAAQLDYVWFYRLTDEQRLQIRLEVGEWNLQKNDMDQAVQSYFDDAMTWYRDNGRKLLEAKNKTNN